MKATFTKPYRLGIAVRTALLSWLVALVSLLVFLSFVIPQQQRTFLENLESKALGVSASLQEVTAGAMVNEAYDHVVEHCLQVLRDDTNIEYLVITKADGFSIICESPTATATNAAAARRSPTWRNDSLTDAWRPQERVAQGGIETVPPFNRRAFHYSRPFDYSGIQWGWIHVGLSLRSFDATAHRVYVRLSLLALMCVALSLAASLLYANRLVKPLLVLQTAVQRLAGGDLSARAEVPTGDEVGDLAHSVNRMADALLLRNRILESVRFTAKELLSTSDWSAAIERVLASLGEASQVGSAYLFENHRGADGAMFASHRCEWLAAGMPPESGKQKWQNVPWHDAGLDRWAELLRAGQIAAVHCRELDPAAQKWVSPGVRSFILLPVMVREEWWGFLGFDHSGAEREWSAADLDSFRAVADMLGAAIERKRAQDALHEAKEIAEAASHAKSQFLANMSHEIRTPITGVMGMLHLLKRTETTPKQSRYVNQALDSADTLLAVIGDVLDFSKIEAGRLELVEDDFSLLEVVDSAVHLFAGRAEQKGIELIGRMDPQLPEVFRGDANRLRQILVNLVGNALKFTERGEVVLSCQLQAVREDGSEIRFEVRDTGCGIAPEHQQVIFEAFAQADSSMSRAHGGTGLGLAISRQLCELMGGSIGVASVPGQGSTFWFTVKLPVARPASEGSQARRARDLRGLRVLVVDDSAVMREAVQELIVAWKGEPVAACDAAAALEELRAAARRGRPVAVAILDWQMPGEDGLSLAARIKQDVALKGTGLVLLTSFASALKEEALGDFAATVSKPIRCSDLFDAVAVAAHGHWVARAADSAGNGVSTPGGAGAAERVPLVLLAEDNEINQEVVTELLGQLGYRFRCVGNGREVVAVVEAGGADVVLMDCQMPGMDGYQATRAIRDWEQELGGNRRVPIIALTAHAMSGDRERCVAAGMDDYLSKPLDPDLLAAKLALWSGWELAKAKNGGSHRNGSGGGSVGAGGMMNANERTQAEAGNQTSVLRRLPSGHEVLDYGALLCRCMGKAALAQRLVGKLVEQGRQDERELRAGLAAGEGERVANAAHRLKGAAANVAANGLRLVAVEIESAARAGRWPEVPGLLARLVVELERLEAEARGRWPEVKVL